MAHYLVTGGLGFIGTHLVRRLIDLDHDVTVLDDLSAGKEKNLVKGAKLVIGDIADESLVSSVLNDAKDGCFHLAAIPSVERCLNEWPAVSQINVLGTISVFEACRKQVSPVPVVYASSAAVYGLHDGVAVENIAVKPASSYGVDKLACEYYAHTAWHNYQLPSVGLRFFNVYGPGQPKSSPYSGVITCFMHAYEQGKPVTIFGDGKQTRDFIYVGDIVDGCIAAMQSDNKTSEVYNLCTAHGASVLDIALTMANIYGVEPVIEHQGARVGEVRHSLGASEKFRADIGAVSEPIALAAGLKKTVEPQSE